MALVILYCFQKDLVTDSSAIAYLLFPAVIVSFAFKNTLATIEGYAVIALAVMCNGVLFSVVGHYGCRVVERLKAWFRNR